jgi:hypothetical protein
MPNTDQNRPAAKPGRRSRKAPPRNPKPEQSPSPQADQLLAAEQPMVETAAPADTAPVEAATEAAPVVAPAPADIPPMDSDAIPADAAPIETDAPDTAPMDADAPADPAPVSLQTIAKAYGDYTRKSLEETRSYVEKLRDVRSLDKAVEVQTEFAKQAFEIFVAGSQKIYGLHKELGKQTLERLVNKPTRDQR